MSIDPHVFVIFGATGDLTKRKLIPALFHLMQNEDIAERCHVLGTARSDWSDDKFRSVAKEALRNADFDEADIDAWCDQRLFYQSLGEDGADFEALQHRIEDIEEQFDLPQNRAFYLSLPPRTYGPTIKQLGEQGLSESDGWTRVVIEKPFGQDLESAKELNDTVHAAFREDQVFRIDHYLGKETVQNLLVFRFANAMFESLWNRDRIERVEITVSENLGVGDRASYYDSSGHVRDMLQNHITQLLSLVTMEPPAAMEGDEIRQEKVKALRAVMPPSPEDVVFGQYSEGEVGGERVPAYTDEPDVPDDSDTETFVALRLEIANWRWRGVPFYIRSGKRLDKKRTQIAVVFQRAPIALFQPGGEPCIPEEAGCSAEPNVLLITLQPNEGFDLRFEVKSPETNSGDMQLDTQHLSFSYRDAFGPIPDAYTTLLRDVITGDQTLFVRSDEVEASWRLYTPLLDADLPVHDYPAGSWGPDETFELLPSWVDGDLRDDGRR
ncbi:glucose-6-phosphate dehydrogenase [Longibacter salinarum]|uniref:Glucose-6-phosphate 1-dehydrogenase n=1 Tax=Longibacter salinarum TaxID=1850348 RepID=A0A2A8CYN4_9BACT|nr:glucose-6-phosphate dehydrogenase [Longibacter salinarum]PEN13713.1 glucose-6-phosphate dehydrogenase [Longibacter salinarum]